MKRLKINPMKNKPNPVATAIILLLIPLLFFITCAKLSAQNGISFNLLHDAKLGLGLDKEHKNDTPTLDIIGSVNLEGQQFEYYYFSIQAQYEYADLHKDFYSRYSVNLMWNFNQLIVRKLKIGTGIGIGMINRKTSEGNGSYSATIEISYPVFKNLSLISKNEWVRRTDLITPKFGYNLSFGLNFKPWKK